VPGVWFYDPGFLYTAAAESAITFVDGDLGILRYRGYPIEQLAEHSTYLEVAYLLNYGELPNEVQAESGSKRSRTTRTFTRTSVSASSKVSTTTRTRWACSSRRSPRFRRTTRTRRSSTIPRSCTVKSFASSQRCPRSPRRPPILGGDAVRLSGQHPGLHGELPLDDVEGRRAPLRAGSVLAHALDVLFILHADHEQNCGTTAMRVVGSSHGDPYSATAAATAALYGPRHGGANEAVLRCSPRSAASTTSRRTSIR